MDFTIWELTPLEILKMDVEHDELAQLTGAFLPPEIKSFFTFDDFDTLIEYCHFPDMTEEPPSRFHTLDDIREIVGEDDAAIIKSCGFHPSWMHLEDGKATYMTLLARAFGRGDRHSAAFYLSCLTHTVGDDGALNHPPLLNFVQYCRFQGVDFGAKKVEPGAKNVFGFRGDGPSMRKTRERMSGYVPQLPPVATFQEQILWHCTRVVPLSVYAAEKEAEIGFAKCDNPSDALADILALLVRSLVDIAWTCWCNRSPDAPLVGPEFKSQYDKCVAELEAVVDPAKQATFGELFDSTKNPEQPVGCVGVVCEALGARGFGMQSYVGRIVSGACGRTLRDKGWSVKGISLRGLKSLSVSETPVVIACLGNDAPTEEIAKAFIDFRNAGGKLIYVSAQDPTAGHDRAVSGRPLVVGKGDFHNISGFADVLRDRECEELPVSPGWGNEGICPDWRTMSVEFQGVKYPIKRNANGDGWSKAVCAQEIVLKEGVEPIAFLNNGKDKFCVAARKGNVTWLPVYMLSPFLFCEDTKLDFGALRLDSFASKVLDRAMS